MKPILSTPDAPPDKSQEADAVPGMLAADPNAGESADPTIDANDRLPLTPDEVEEIADEILEAGIKPVPVVHFPDRGDNYIAQVDLMDTGYMLGGVFRRRSTGRLAVWISTKRQCDVGTVPQAIDLIVETADPE